MSARPRTRVLVIDDSAYSRRTLTRLLEGPAGAEVVGFARDGEEALRKTLELEPDLVTLDLEMPRMGGFTFLRLLMARRPTAVLVVSSRSGESDVFKALELGAVDFIAKPTARPVPELASIEQELVRKVRAVRELRIDRLRQQPGRPPSPAPPQTAPFRTPRLVAVGASTGGPAALMHLFASFSEAPPYAIAVAQHMPEGFTRSFAERLDRLSPLAVREARGGEPIEPGRAWVAPGGSHLEIETCGGRLQTRVAKRGDRDRYTPSVDRLFESAAGALAGELVAVVLTGMGDDGRRGAGAVKEHGGTVIAEAEESAVIFGMPRQAIASGAVDWVVPLDEVTEAIRRGGADPRGQPPGRGPE